jgi:hypothetical protein
MQFSFGNWLDRVTSLMCGGGGAEYIGWFLLVVLIVISIISIAFGSNIDFSTES